MKTSRILLILGFIATSGCSPFGNETVASVISTITEIFGGGTTDDVNSGGSEIINTTDQHQVSMSIGNQMSHTSTMVSADGHEVDITLSSE